MLVVVVTVYEVTVVYYDCYGIYRDDDDDDDDETFFSFIIYENRVCCSLGYCSTYIGTPNVRVKVLWVCESSEVRFFLGQKLLNSL